MNIYVYLHIFDILDFKNPLIILLIDALLDIQLSKQDTVSVFFLSFLVRLSFILLHKTYLQLVNKIIFVLGFFFISQDEVREREEKKKKKEEKKWIAKN